MKSWSSFVFITQLPVCRIFSPFQTLSSSSQILSIQICRYLALHERCRSKLGKPLFGRPGPPPTHPRGEGGAGGALEEAPATSPRTPTREAKTQGQDARDVMQPGNFP